MTRMKDAHYATRGALLSSQQICLATLGLRVGVEGLQLEAQGSIRAVLSELSTGLGVKYVLESVLSKKNGTQPFEI